MNDLESGLYLPIRFYYQQTEQDRFKRPSLGVALTELNYPYVDCTSLAPFQVSYMSSELAVAVQFNAFCADTNEIITLTFNAAYWEEFINSDGIYYLSYLGTDDFSGRLSNGLYYLGVVIQFTDETIYLHSDLFMIINCNTTPYIREDYRVWSNKVGEMKRLVRCLVFRLVVVCLNASSNDAG